jgi:chitin disaccharide deacetylase
VSKQIIICADDFAQNEEISDGILSLAKHQRINAISCLVNTSHWDDLYTELSSIKQKNYIGLHLNFTFGQPLSSLWRKTEGEQFLGLPSLIRRLYLRQINIKTIVAEIQAQIDVFTHTMHVYPDFIDGHQHVQQLPIVRQALLEVHASKMGHVYSSITENDEPHEEDLDHCDSFFRNTSNGLGDLCSIVGFPKIQALNILGGRKFRRQLIREQIPTNSSFAGIYNFSKAENYRKYFQRFLNKTKSGGIIMCHPGCYSKDLSDPLHMSRHHELNYFMSDVFLSDIEDNYFKLTTRD